MLNLLNVEHVNGLMLGQTLATAQPGQGIRLPLADNRADAPQIIAYLKELSIAFGRDPFVREFTVSLFPSTMRDNDLEGMLRIIAAFVRDRMLYVPDPQGTEYVISPVILLQRISANGRAAGDCDDHVLLFNSMMTSVGFPVRVAGVHLNEPVLWDHVISQVWINNQWLDVDLCLKNGQVPDYMERLVS